MIPFCSYSAKASYIRERSSLQLLSPCDLAGPYLRRFSQMQQILQKFDILMNRDDILASKFVGLTYQRECQARDPIGTWQ